MLTYENPEGSVSVIPAAAPKPLARIVTVTCPPGSTDAGSKLRVAVGVVCAVAGITAIKATTPAIAATMAGVVKTALCFNRGFRVWWGIPLRSRFARPRPPYASRRGEFCPLAALVILILAVRLGHPPLASHRAPLRCAKGAYIFPSSPGA